MNDSSADIFMLWVSFQFQLDLCKSNFLNVMVNLAINQEILWFKRDSWHNL